MATTLITFLGRVPKAEGSYRKTRYDFGDGTPQEEVAFFGWALARRLQPQRLVILGTNGSMWDHLFDGDLRLGGTQEDERFALMFAADEKRATQSQLDALAPLLADHLGIDVVLRIIPYCRNEAEQMAVLSLMAEAVHPHDTVHLDVTHGFRHLPMLALLAALYLQHARKAHVAGIWYGAFDPDTGSAPVHDLRGLITLAEGLQALAAFDFSGDYRAFAPVLAEAGHGDLAQKLNAAGYYENILNVSAATGKLREVIPDLTALAKHNDAAGLLAPLIQNRVEWLYQKKEYDKQRALARNALERHDYLRAVLYAYEAVITRLCQQAGVSITDFDQRERVRKAYEERVWNGEEGKRYRLLKDLRNQVAHGNRGNRAEVQQALLNEREMRKTLAALLDEIDHGRLPSTPDA